MWIKEKLATLDLPAGTKILNIGSSNADFLKSQPHINMNVVEPLKSRGCNVLNMDFKHGEGVDLTGDIEETGLNGRLAEKFGVVMCTNLLEHVKDRDTVFRNAIDFTEESGYLLVTVPRNYPRHNDPIDTLYRPSPEELASEIGKWAASETLFSETLDIKNAMYYFYESRLPFWGYRRLLFWRYWFKKSRWKVSCVICRINGRASRPALSPERDKL